MEVFVIHLPHRNDRYIHLQKLHKIYRSFNLEIVHGIRRPNGAEGCRLSHQSIVARAKKEGRPYVIVLEDDCDFLVSNAVLYDRMKVCVEYLQTQPEIQCITGCGNIAVLINGETPPVTVVQSFRDFKLLNVPNVSTSHCVIYSASAYDAILEWKEGTVVDVALNDLNLVVAHPFLATQIPCYSDIEQKNVHYDNVGLSQAYLRTVVPKE